MTMIIEVTAEDINNGRPQNPCFCPIALAIKRAARTNNVNVSHCLLINNKYYSLPSPARDFISHFDFYGKYSSIIQPFNFELAV